MENSRIKLWHPECSSPTQCPELDYFAICVAALPVWSLKWTVKILALHQWPASRVDSVTTAVLLRVVVTSFLDRVCRHTSAPHETRGKFVVCNNIFIMIIRFKQNMFWFSSSSHPRQRQHNGRIVDGRCYLKEKERQVVGAGEGRWGKKTKHKQLKHEL